MLVALAGEVIHPHFYAELLQLFVAGFGRTGVGNIARLALLHSAAIVEQPDAQLFRRVIHVAGSGQSIGQKLFVLVVAWHEDIDGRQVFVAARSAAWPRRRQRHGNDEQAERQHQHAVHFCQIDKHAGNEVFQLVDRRQRACRAPVDITQHHPCTEGKRHQSPFSTDIQKLDDRHDRDDQDACDQLRARIDRQGHQKDDHHRGDGPDNG
ncbi:hypothetical protein D3C73_459790 [compost metagenome]